MKIAKTIKTMEIVKTICFVFIIQIFSASSIFAGSISSIEDTDINKVDNVNDIINQAIARRDQILKGSKERKEGIEEYKKITTQKIKDIQGTSSYKRLINSIQEHQRYQRYQGHQGQENQSNSTASEGMMQSIPQAIVFVSFSMPLLSLQQIVQDASRYQIPVVMRGLYNNSFKETAIKIFEVVKENNQGGILIDPLWFKKCDIKNVPALVINQNDIFDVVYGNIPLRRALGIIAEKSENKAITALAHRILKEGAHGQY